MARAGDFISLGGLSLLEFIARHDARGKILGVFIYPEGVKLQMERLRIEFKKRNPTLSKKEESPALHRAGEKPIYLTLDNPRFTKVNLEKMLEIAVEHNLTAASGLTLAEFIASSEAQGKVVGAFISPNEISLQMWGLGTVKLAKTPHDPTQKKEGRTALRNA